MQCYVSVQQDTDKQFKEKDEKNFSTFHLPDGQTVQLSSEKI